jgi:hypothetical protein
MTARQYDELVLGIRPSPRGFAYALFEAPLSPVDWGVREFEAAHKNIPTRDAVAKLCAKYRPDTLVLEDRSHLSAARYGRVRRLQAILASMAQQQGIDVVYYSRAAVRNAFHYEPISRHDIAQAIAAFIPAFEPLMPPRRKIWQSDHPRLWLFDAAALSMTHFAAIAGAEPP